MHDLHWFAAPGPGIWFPTSSASSCRLSSSCEIRRFFMKSLCPTAFCVSRFIREPQPHNAYCAYDIYAIFLFSMHDQS